MSSDKAQLRLAAMAQRKTVDLALVSEQLRSHLLDWPQWQKARRVLAYAPFRGEANLLPLALLAKAAQWALPVTQDNGTLKFYAYSPSLNDPLDGLHVGRYGIFEPMSLMDEDAILQPGEGDLVLVPGLLFDTAGYRLGYGKGYYDRFLNQPGSNQALFVGVSILDISRSPLPKENWDIRMKYVLSPQGFLKV